MTYRKQEGATAPVCEVGDCREPAFCLAGIGLSGSMYVCERHGEAANRLNFPTGFSQAALASTTDDLGSSPSSGLGSLAGVSE
jgi:hypothetical protein